MRTAGSEVRFMAVPILRGCGQRLFSLPGHSGLRWRRGQAENVAWCRVAIICPWEGPGGF